MRSTIHDKSSIPRGILNHITYHQALCTLTIGVILSNPDLAALKTKASVALWAAIFFDFQTILVYRNPTDGFRTSSRIFQQIVHIYLFCNFIPFKLGIASNQLQL